MSARESVSLGGTYYSLAKQFLFVGWEWVMTIGSHPLSQSLSERSEVSCAPGEPESSCRGAASGPPNTYTVVSGAGGISVGKGGSSGLAIPSDSSSSLGVSLMEALSKCPARSVTAPA